jgi:hypothetical protein
MNEQELRQLVRDAIARHGGTTASALPCSAHPVPAPRTHASHAMFVLTDGADAGGPCVIEPAVPCNHCGYCKSYGH